VPRDAISLRARLAINRAGTHRELMALNRFYSSFVARQMSSQREEQLAVDVATPVAAAPAAALAAAPAAAPASAPAAAAAPAAVPPGAIVSHNYDPTPVGGGRAQAGGAEPASTAPLNVAQVTDALRQLPREQVLAILSEAGHAPPVGDML
jgi:predicted lipid-binding transport protein (Tim44 family)